MKSKLSSKTDIYWPYTSLLCCLLLTYAMSMSEYPLKLIIYSHYFLTLYSIDFNICCFEKYQQKSCLLTSSCLTSHFDALMLYSRCVSTWWHHLFGVVTGTVLLIKLNLFQSCSPLKPKIREGKEALMFSLVLSLTCSWGDSTGCLD